MLSLEESTAFISSMFNSLCSNFKVAGKKGQLLSLPSCFCSLASIRQEEL